MPQLASSSPPAPMLQAHRYFFALRPDRQTAHRIHAFAVATLGEKGLLPPERLHVTLALTPDFPVPQPALMAALVQAGDSVAAPPFTLRLDRLSIGARTAALRPAKAIPALRTLQAAIAHEMKRAGAAMRPDWQFHPHLTLRYRADTPSRRAVDDFGWAVEGFVLLESLVGLSRHVLRGRWPLRAVPDPQGALFAD